MYACIVLIALRRVAKEFANNQRSTDFLVHISAHTADGNNNCTAVSKGLVTFTSTSQSNFFEVVQVLAIIIVYNLISLYFLSRMSCYCVSFFGKFLFWPIAELLQRLAHLLSFGYFSFDSVGWDLQSNVRRSWLIDYGVSNTKETKQILMIKSANNRKFKKKPAFTWRCSRWTLIYRLRCHLFFVFFH